MQNEILALIDHVQEQTELADMAVMSSLLQAYTKSIMMAEQCVDSDAFDIFQEAFDYSTVDNSGYETLKGEPAEQPLKMEKFKRDLNAPVLGNKDESMGKRILMVIPRLIKKLIEMIKKFLNRTKVESNKIKQIADSCLKAYDSLTPEQKTEFNDIMHEPELYYYAASDSLSNYTNYYIMTISTIRDAFIISGIYKFREKAGDPSIPFEEITDEINKLVMTNPIPKMRDDITKGCKKYFNIDLTKDVTYRIVEYSYKPAKGKIKGTELPELLKTIQDQATKVFDELGDCSLAITVLLHAIESHINKLGSGDIGKIVDFADINSVIDVLTGYQEWIHKYERLFGIMVEHDQIMLYREMKDSIGHMGIEFGFKRIDKFAKQSERETPSERAINKGL